ncbi:hypothetical protein M9H77_36391 [Catharanthus roseus]|uniref:Uncharacterized protein n=1 Tax=Catharanthus roseus TaxID=4058 RepID=A0ACB9ZSZ1_CATRO|nr:hypothetical protein M9H77_36391 [Catharanthus roseus]
MWSWVKGDYHGILNEILEVGFPGIPSQKVVLFKCDWFDSSLHQGLKIHDKYTLVELHIKRKYAGSMILSLYPNRPNKLRILEVPLIDVPFIEDIDIDKTSRIDVDVQDIETLIHESGELESVEIRRRNSIGDENDNNEDEEEVKWESNNKEEEEEAHLETSTPASASILPGTFALASASSGTSTSSTMISTPPATLTLFPQLSYLSLPPISTSSSSSSSSSAAGTSSRPASSSSARPSVTPPVQGAVDSQIFILPTADMYLL